jgi:hypothetical protein
MDAKCWIAHKNRAIAEHEPFEEQV